MSKIVSGGIAVLRGYFKNSFIKLFNFRGFKFGHMPIIEKNVEIEVDSGSSCIFGKKCDFYFVDTLEMCTFESVLNLKRITKY